MFKYQKTDKINMILKMAMKGMYENQFICYKIYKLAPMNEEANEKVFQFKNQIRRKQRQTILKKNRQSLLAQLKKQKLNGEPIIAQSSTQISSNLTQQIAENSVKGLLTTFTEHPNYMESVPESMLPDIMKLITTKQSMQTMEGIRLLGLFVQFCGNISPKMQSKVKIIRKCVQQAKIQEALFKLIQKNRKSGDNLKAKMLLFCIKNMAFIRMQSVRDKQLLEAYLLPIIQNYIGQVSTIVFLCYVSEVFPFSPEVIRLICEQSTPGNKTVKIIICSILSNYITLETNVENIRLLFEQLLRTLMYLYLQCKGYSQKYAIQAMEPIFKLIARYPEGRGEQLLLRAENCKLHVMTLLLMSLGSSEMKQIAYDIQETLIDKSIHQIQQRFFQLFSQDMITQILTDINSTDANIIERSLKILVKLLNYAPPRIAALLQSKHSLIYSLENLSYHKNQFIAEIAMQVMTDLQKIVEKTNQMNDD